MLQFGPLLALAAPLAWSRGRLKGAPPDPRARRTALRERVGLAARLRVDAARPSEPGTSPRAGRDRRPPRRPGRSPATAASPAARLPGATRTPRSNSPRRPRGRGARARRAVGGYADPHGRDRRCGRPRRRPRRRQPSAPAAARRLAAAAAGLLRPSILYSKGDVAGLTALAAAATDADERTALEWAALRADAAPVLRLARRLPRGSSGLAKPRLDSRAAGGRSRRASAGAGGGRRIFRRRAAAVERGQARRGARGAGDGPRRRGVANHPRPCGATAISTRWTESVILREFGASLTKADHKYRADRLLYAELLGAGARAAALAGPDESGARPGPHRGGARAAEPAALIEAVPPALRNDPGLLFSRIQYARRAGRRLRSGGHAEPRAARSRRARRSGSMVERAEDGRARAARPRRAAAGV